MGRIITGYEIKMHSPDCLPGAPVYAAKAALDDDASAVMPYLNSVLNRAFFGGEGEFVVWQEGGRKFALRPRELAVGSVLDREEAEEVVEKTVAWINDIWEKRDEIEPDYEKRQPPPALEVFKLLPRTNCGECGFSSCLGFAAELVQGNRRIEDCPPLREEENRHTVEQLKKMGL